MFFRRPQHYHLGIVNLPILIYIKIILVKNEKYTGSRFVNVYPSMFELYKKRRDICNDENGAHAVAKNIRNILIQNVEPRSKY